MKSRPIFVTGMFLSLFAVVGTAMVAFTYQGTAERIADNERAALLKSLHEIIPAEMHDNDIFHDMIEVYDPNLLGSDEPVAAYRARKAGWPVAAVLAPIAPDGYNGTIKLLVGIKLDGTLAGVRVVAHQETPGLGDGIEEKKSDWILGFSGRSPGDPPVEMWKVKRDGGVFDQFTGATITPRAIVKAVLQSLVYFAQNRDGLFAEDPEVVPGETDNL